jgi:CHAT domain-containing protein/tetratricopeptide (TPR) repeat protein
MNREELARSLVQAGNMERQTLLARHPALADVVLAHVLKRIYDDAESSDPEQAAGAAGALASLSSFTDRLEVRALAAWTVGMAALDSGQMEESIAQLEAAEESFLALGRPDTAAATQVSKLIALAVLGRYEEAVACGLQARDVLLAHGDLLAAGKVEGNLGNIYGRREQHAESERFFRVARERFVAAGEQKQLVQIENCLATALMFQHRFRDACQMYEQALVRAEGAGLEVTQAEIECNLGNLSLFQSHYDRALDFLERSRRRYASLGMPHESAIAELEQADAYLELNLASEAATIYERVVPTFAELGMRAEQARALAHHGRARVLLGETDRARALLAEAYTLYTAEGNSVGAAMVTLTEAQLGYAEGRYTAAAAAAAQAEAPLAAAGTWGRALRARWLHGEARRALGDARAARELLESALREAERQMVPQVVQRCHTSLGLLAASLGDTAGAEALFSCAVTLIEEMRAPLPAEEFRTAFFADKLTPYAELVRLCLAGGTERVAEALGYIERSRARALMDIIGGALISHPRPHDPFEVGLLERSDTLRGELSWLYSQINRPPEGEIARSAPAMEALHREVRDREATVLEITRQLQQRSQSAIVPIEPFDLALLQHDLGADTALVEYFSLDGALLAFVVTGEGIEAVGLPANEAQVQVALEQFRFQVSTLRYGAAHMREHLGQLTLRARHHLALLYDLLLRPIAERLGTRRLVVVPHRVLYYVPFHALYDGVSYLIEQREVAGVPSASVLRHCMARPQRPLDRALLMGVSDERAPRVRDEVLALAPLFPQADMLLDEQATLVALRERAPGADVVHLACHGQFRPDNPLFSALHLADGWLTVRDTSSLDLRCGLVALSACETGAGAVAPGDELISLARGFFSAGAPTLLVSLWTVDDETTALLMAGFYSRLRAGDGPAAALRYAQRTLLEQYPHPFFWAPFVLLGRW